MVYEVVLMQINDKNHEDRSYNFKENCKHTYNTYRRNGSWSEKCESFFLAWKKTSLDLNALSKVVENTIQI